MQPTRIIHSRSLVLERENIDTDQIIPARFLTTTERVGLGAHAFADWRDSGTALDDPRASGAQVLVAGRNFGCGSSREHAPWALLDFGFRAVVSSEIADIFRTNAAKNGLLPVVIDAAAHAQLIAEPWQDLVIDVEACTLTTSHGEVHHFPLDGFTRRCFLEGKDELDLILDHSAAISRFEEARP